jgi:hemoglobin
MVYYDVPPSNIVPKALSLLLNCNRMKTLYAILGDDNLQKLVEEFYARVQENEVLAPLFKGDFEVIKEKQFLFLTQFLGGPQRYTEKFGHPRMRMRHMPHPIDERAMEEWLSCMKSAIQTLSLSDELKEALYACFPPVARHMVNS